MHLKTTHLVVRQRCFIGSVVPVHSIQVAGGLIGLHLVIPMDLHTVWHCMMVEHHQDEEWPLLAGCKCGPGSRNSNSMVQQPPGQGAENASQYQPANVLFFPFKVYPSLPIVALWIKCNSMVVALHGRALSVACGTTAGGKVRRLLCEATLPNTPQA